MFILIIIHSMHALWDICWTRTHAISYDIRKCSKTKQQTTLLSSLTRQSHVLYWVCQHIKMKWEKNTCKCTLRIVRACALVIVHLVMKNRMRIVKLSRHFIYSHTSSTQCLRSRCKVCMLRRWAEMNGFVMILVCMCVCKHIDVIQTTLSKQRTRSHF